MAVSPRSSLLAAAALALFATAAPSPAPAAMSPAEQLFADLAKLPAEERQKRIIEGSKKEGKFSGASSYRGTLGRDQNKLFLKDHGWIDFDLDNNRAQSESAEKLIAESTAGKFLTDARSFSLPDMTVFMDKDLFALYPTPVVERVLPRYQKFVDARLKDKWLPWAWDPHGISYNPDMIKPADAPKSWMDLCKPAFANQVSFEPAETNYLLGLSQYFGEAKFEEFMKCMGANKPIIMKGHTTRLQLMMAGDHAIQGDNFIYMGYMLNEKNPKKAPFQIVYEAPLISHAVGMSVTKNAPHPYTAALYTDWLLGAENQHFVASIYRGPITQAHPFLPEKAEISVGGLATNPDVDRVHRIWQKYMGRS
jgi:iron(III) transport system substrate-binding protein